MRAGTQGRIARFGIFEADLDRRRLTKAGFRIKLQDQPFQILELLVERPGQIVTRDELKEKIWSGDTFVAFDDGLNTAIKKLRAALSDAADNPRFVETVPRVGYRFLAPVTIDQPSSLNASPLSTSEEATSAVPRDVETSAPPNAQPLAPANPIRSRRGWWWALAALVIVMVALGARHWPRHSAPSQTDPIGAIAVLPLQNTSGDSSQDYLADGMTDEIITDLAKLAGPKVISRTSAMQYKGTQKKIPDIARELRVGAVVEGSVERSGDRMRVRVQLIDAATDQHLWAESYDRQMSDVLQLESDVAKDIATQIQLHLTSQQQQNLAHNRITNPQAFQDYLQGRQYFALRSKEGLLKAVDLYHRAIAEDPGDARSYAGLAQCYIVLPLLYDTSKSDDYAKARAAADKALALDDSLAEAHLARAEVLFNDDWDFSGAEKEFRRTLELNPNYATGHQWYGEFLSALARPDEGIREEETAVALDPLSSIVHHQLGQSYQQAHQYDRAYPEYENALELNPGFMYSWEAMSWAYRRQEKFAESLAALHHGLTVWEPDYPGITAAFAGMEHGLEQKGKDGFLHDAMAFHRHYPRPNLYLARDCADLGQPAEALSYLARSKQAHEPEFLYILTDPEFDRMRTDPKFQQLAQIATKN